MKPYIFQIDADTLERYGTLEADDLGRWALVVKGAMVCIEDEEEYAQERLDLLSEEPEDLESIYFDAELQSDDGDGEDGGAYGGYFDGIDLDNHHADEDWNDEDATYE